MTEGNPMQRVIITAVLPLLLLIGCEAKKEEAKVQTVDWYLAHDAERKATLKECQNNPGELGQTPNCENASVATRRAAARTTIDLNNF